MRSKNALYVARNTGWFNIERLLLFAQLNVNMGNEIKNTAQFIQKQDGINDNILHELSNIGAQSKEIWEKVTMEIMINIINKRCSYSDDLLNLCWNIASRDNKNPLQSELWKALSTQCKNIIENGNKLDWYWLKKCVLPSTV